MRNSVIGLVLVSLLTGCGDTGDGPSMEAPDGDLPILETFAESDRQWTGVAVTPDNRVFVNFPRWWVDSALSVAEVVGDGTLRPFPDAAWNEWDLDADPAWSFVCVQSVVADDQGFVWILDPANPWFQGVVPGGAKLVQVEPATSSVVRVFRFGDDIAPRDSYLNDVRIDSAHQTAYITDSGAGAVVVVDLGTGSSRRVLDDHPSTSAEDTILVIDGERWLQADGSAPQVHADGIAYDPINDLLYYQALTGRTLYRVAGAALRDPTLDEAALDLAVETVVRSGPSDGLLWDGSDGILISAIEEDAIKRWSPVRGVETVISDPRIAWPDSFARGPDGALYVTTSQIHRGPNPPDPYRVLRLGGF